MERLHQLVISVENSGWGNTSAIVSAVSAIVSAVVVAVVAVVGLLSKLRHNRPNLIIEHTRVRGYWGKPLCQIAEGAKVINQGNLPAYNIEIKFSDGGSPHKIETLAIGGEKEFPFFQIFDEDADTKKLFDWRRYVISYESSAGKKYCTVSEGGRVKILVI